MKYIDFLCIQSTAFHSLLLRQAVSEPGNTQINFKDYLENKTYQDMNTNMQKRNVQNVFGACCMFSLCLCVFSLGILVFKLMYVRNVSVDVCFSLCAVHNKTATALTLRQLG